MLETYVLTLDTQQSLKAAGFDTNVYDLERELMQIIKEVLPDTEIVGVTYGELKNELQKIVREIRDTMPVISLDPMYIPVADEIISITRLIDPETGIKKEGPRPYFPPLEEQVKELSKKYKGKNIALADVGVFEGGSEKLLISLLKDAGISVDYVINGVSTTSADEIFKELGVTEIPVYKFVSEKNDEFVFDWLEAADLTGIDGRKVGRNGVPAEIKRIPQVYIPYALGDICKWASIPQECSEDVSNKFLNITNKIVDRIEKNRGSPVTIGELGLPVSMGNCIDELTKYYVNPEMPFKDALNLAIKKCSEK